MYRILALAVLSWLPVVLSAAPRSGVKADNLLAKIPLHFESDGGGFTAQTRDYRLTLAKNGLQFRWNNLAHPAAPVRLRLVGGSPQASLAGDGVLPSYTNYFVGTNSSSWRTGLPNYQRARLRNVYKGVDLVLYGSEDSLEFDFDIAPGASPKVIRMAVEGPAHARIEQGALVFQTPGGKVNWSRPLIYQTVAGVRRPVAGSFVLKHGGRSIEFEVGGYNPALPLTIDPVLSIATYFGSTQNEAARGIAVDASGNIFIAGYTASPKLPVSGNAFQSGYGGGTKSYQTGDAFVAKFNPSGSLAAMTYLGGNADDVATSLALDSAGNVYVTGYTNSPDFPTQHPIQSQMRGAGGNSVFTFGDAFITKLNPGLSQVVYSTYFGGAMDEVGMGIAVDSTGAAYITGVTLSSNFPTTATAFQKVYHGAGGQPVTDFGAPFFVTGDAFVTKLSPDGSSLVFSTYLGGTQDDAAMAIAVDSSSNVYVGGFTISNNFPTTAGALQSAYAGYEGTNVFYNFGDGFVAKLNPAGSALLYSTYLGGGGDDMVTALAVDSAGNVYATGSTTSPDFPTTKGAFQTTNAGPVSDSGSSERVVGDAFAVKIKPDGSSLVFGTFLGGSADDGGNTIAVDSAGNVYVGGNTVSGGFPVTADAAQKAFGGYNQGTEHYNNDLIGDGFVAILNSTGTSETYGTFLGGGADDAVEGLALDASGNIFLTGVTMSKNFPVTNGAYQATFGGYNSVFYAGAGRIYGDAFVARLSGSATGTFSAAPTGVTVTYTPGSANPSPVNVALSSSSPVPFSVATGGEPWLTVSPSSGQTPATLKVTVDPTGLAANTYTATITVSTTTAGYPALKIPVNFTVAGNGPFFTAGSIVNAASGLPGPVAPGEMVLFYTLNAGPAALAGAQLNSSGLVSTAVAGTQVFFAGVAAPIIYTQAGQVSVVVPYAVAGKSSVPVQILYNGVQSSVVNVPVAATSPALFTINEQGTGQAALLNPDYSVNSSNKPAKPGDEIQLFGTGEGVNNQPSLADGTLANNVPYPTAIAPASVTVGNVPAKTVAYVGTAPGGVLGFLQVNIIVPDGVPSGNQPIVVTIGGVSSPSNVTVAIQ